MIHPEEGKSAEELAALVETYLQTSEGGPASGERSRTGLPCGTVCSSNNQYVIREEIGRGGMGAVFRAFDAKLQRDVALKILDSADDDYLDRFLREQEITACLDHPNFGRILATGYISTKDRTVPFYTMPLIRGQNLERLVLRQGLPGTEGERMRQEFPPEMLLHLFGQLCLTLRSAHDVRIIHRDLKPSNVLVGPYGDAYVTDLGLAKFLGVPSKETGRFERHVMEQLVRLGRLASMTDGTLGTPYYMAPEQILAPWTVDHRADIFGLGGILYFILTGQRTEFVAPDLDGAAVDERKRGLEGRLEEYGWAPPQIPQLLKQPKSEISRKIWSLAQEYEDLVGLEQKSEYHKFRLTMRDCEIVPPRCALAARQADLAEQGAPVVHRPEIAPELEAICMKALAKDPDDRFPSCQALWQALLPHSTGPGSRSSLEPLAQP